MKPELAGAQGRPSIHMVVTIIHALGKHQPNRDLATPILLLREIKLWYILSDLLHSAALTGRPHPEAGEVRVSGQR